MWQRWGDTVRFLLWGLTVALVCFLLYRVVMNNNAPHLVPLSEGGRDSLMTVGMPRGMSDTLVNYGNAFAVYFNSRRGIANCAAYELTRNELNGTAERSNEFMHDPGVKGAPRLPTMPAAVWTAAIWCLPPTSSGTRKPCASRSCSPTCARCTRP